MSIELAKFNEKGLSELATIRLNGIARTIYDKLKIL